MLCLSEKNTIDRRWITTSVDQALTQLKMRRFCMFCWMRTKMSMIYANFLQVLVQTHNHLFADLSSISPDHYYLSYYYLDRWRWPMTLFCGNTTHSSWTDDVANYCAWCFHKTKQLQYYLKTAMLSVCLFNVREKVKNTCKICRLAHVQKTAESLHLYIHTVWFMEDE
jgi:hypothetical protein